MTCQTAIMHFKTNAFEFVTDGMCKSQLSVLCLCHGPHQICHVNSQKHMLLVELRGEAKHQYTVGVKIVSSVQLLPVLREQMMSSWPSLSCLPVVWNVPLSAQCVCFCRSLSVSACALWQCPWFCMKFHHTIYAHKPSDTHLKTTPLQSEAAC